MIHRFKVPILSHGEGDAAVTLYFHDDRAWLGTNADPVEIDVALDETENPNSSCISVGQAAEALEKPVALVLSELKLRHPEWDYRCEYRENDFDVAVKSEAAQKEQYPMECLEDVEG